MRFVPRDGVSKAFGQGPSQPAESHRHTPAFQIFWSEELNTSIMPQHNTPLAIRRAEGNPGQRPIPENEPQADRGIPTMPPFMSQRAQGVWNELAPLLLELGTLTVVDGVALEALCNQIVYLREAQHSIDTEGILVTTQHGPRKNPACNVANESLKQVRSLLGEFGLTPAARARIPSTNPAHGNLLEQWLADDARTERNGPDTQSLV